MSKHYYRADQYQSRRSIGYLLRRAGKLITVQIEALFAKQDISFVQWVILMHLREGISMTAAELSQHLCHDSGALTRVIDQMEEGGLVRRKRSRTDRRVVALDLTPAGRKAIEAYLPRVVEFYNHLLGDFSQAEVDQLIGLLTRLVSRLSELPRPAEKE